MKKTCRNVSCATHGFYVTTERDDCLSCNKPLTPLRNPLDDLFNDWTKRP